MIHPRTRQDVLYRTAQHWRAVVALVVLLAATVALRAWQARLLLMPAWVDSVHHALLVRMLVGQGHLPGTWAPYLPEVPFYYHFGFHLTAAALARITGLDPGRAVLIAGHFWQAGMVFAVYLAGRILWRDERAWMAALLVAFVSEMPAHYVTWGRYTLLAGLVVMTLAIAAALRGRSVLLAIATIAAGITHYYAFALLCLFVACLFIFDPGKRRPLLLGLGAGLLVLAPWFWRVIVYGKQFVVIETVDANVPLLVTFLGPVRNYLLLALAAAGSASIIVQAVRRQPQRSSLALVLWLLIQVLLLGPWHVGPFRPDHAAIVLFVPVVFLAAEALWLVPRRILAWLIVALLVVWGAWQTRSIVNPETLLVSQGDLAALEWVGQQAPADATFIVDVAPWGGFWRGVDGGWWIAPLTGRHTMPPPAAYTWGPEDLVDRVDRIARRLNDLAGLPDHLYCQELRLLAGDTGAGYYFTRTQRPEICPGWRAVYEGGAGAWVYAIE